LIRRSTGGAIASSGAERSMITGNLSSRDVEALIACGSTPATYRSSPAVAAMNIRNGESSARVMRM
jgi:hypothetical protein